MHQLKRGYALNLSILVSAAQKQKLTRILLVTASEVGNTVNDWNPCGFTYKLNIII